MHDPNKVRFDVECTTTTFLTRSRSPSHPYSLVLSSSIISIFVPTLTFPYAAAIYS